MGKGKKGKKEKKEKKQKIKVKGKSGMVVIGTTSANALGFGLAGVSQVMEMACLKTEREGLQHQIDLRKNENQIIALRSIYQDKAFQEKERKNFEDEFKARQSIQDQQRAFQLEKEAFAEKMKQDELELQRKYKDAGKEEELAMRQKAVEYQKQETELKAQLHEAQERAEKLDMEIQARDEEKEKIIAKMETQAK